VSRRKTSNLGTLAAGRRVVVSAGTLDGPFLAALARILPAAGSDVPTSTWADGVNGISKSDSSSPQEGKDA
jgi:NCAIR mutase (PurE)-related protein